MALPAVDDDQIRRFFSKLFQGTAQHFAHHGIVVNPLYCANLEETIAILCKAPILPCHKGTYRFTPLYRRNIKGADIRRRLYQSKFCGDININTAVSGSAAGQEMEPGVLV